jgi:hypothetical protein
MPRIYIPPDLTLRPIPHQQQQASNMNAFRSLASKVAPVAARRALSTAEVSTPGSFKATWVVGEVRRRLLFFVCIFRNWPCLKQAYSSGRASRRHGGNSIAVCPLHRLKICHE